jgi:hypothetical protein
MPFSASASNLSMIPVALGGLAGLYIFFRGFSQLQREQQVAGKTQTAETLPEVKSAQPEPGPTDETHREIIRLTPADEVTSTTPLSQQARIAAALLKAGKPNPVSWSASVERVLVTVELAEAQHKNGKETKKAVEALNRSAFTVLKDPALRIAPSHPDTPDSFSWKAALMIWGGPVLTFACAYLLAAHFGLL